MGERESLPRREDVTRTSSRGRAAVLRLRSANTAFIAVLAIWRSQEAHTSARDRSPNATERKRRQIQHSGE